MLPKLLVFRDHQSNCPSFPYRAETFARDYSLVTSEPIDASDDKAMELAARIDNRAFKGKGFGVPTLKNIAAHGLVVATSIVRTERNGRFLDEIADRNDLPKGQEKMMLNVSELVTSPIEEAEEPIVQQLPPHVAYLAGTATAEGAWGMGLGVIAMIAREFFARLIDPKKKTMVGTARWENRNELAIATKLGYAATAIAYAYYAIHSDSEDILPPPSGLPRIMPRSLFEHTIPGFDQHAGTRAIIARDLTDTHRRQTVCTAKPYDLYLEPPPAPNLCTKINIKAGDAPDPRARRGASYLLGQSYVLTSVGPLNSQGRFEAHFCRTDLPRWHHRQDDFGVPIRLRNAGGVSPFIYEPDI